MAALERDFELVVPGGGPGGYVAAIRAAQLGLSTCVIDVHPLGGICVNWGCIPSKALLKTAEYFQDLQNLVPSLGIQAEVRGLDWARVSSLKAKAADILNTIHAHPTLTEAVMEAAAAAHEHAIHYLGRA